MAFPQRFLDELRERLPLSQVIGKRIKLVKKGKDYMGLCPFHQEKSPSFKVDDHKGYFYCFGCGAGGDAIAFLEKSQNLNFAEAVETLAAQAGMMVPRDNPRERAVQQRLSSLYDVLERACQWFEHNLKNSQNYKVKQYLLDRGLIPEIISKFRIGFSPDHRYSLQKVLEAEGASHKLMHEAGLLFRIEEKDEYVSRFRGRVMFPILDERGRVIAFGGRVIGDGQPKYLNSPETPLFNKGQRLFGYYQARNERPSESPIVVCEGYMDVIALQQAGFQGAVAPLGTAMTESQLELSWRLNPEPFLCFDGDAAGQRAADRALERALPLIKPGCSLRFIELPKGQDPDSLLQSGGAQEFTKFLSMAQPLFTRLVTSLSLNRPLDTPERKAGLQKDLLDKVSLIQDRSVRELYRSEVYNWLRTQGNRKKGTQVPTKASTKMPLNPGRIQRKILLAIVLNHPIVAHEVAEQLMELKFPEKDLELLRQALISVIEEENMELDTSLVMRLSACGYGKILNEVLGADTYLHAAFAHPKVESDQALEGWQEVLHHYQGQQQLTQDLQEAQQELLTDMNQGAWLRLQRLKTLTLNNTGSGSDRKG